MVGVHHNMRNCIKRVAALGRLRTSALETDERATALQFHPHPQPGAFFFCIFGLLLSHTCTFTLISKVISQHSLLSRAPSYTVLLLPSTKAIALPCYLLQGISGKSVIFKALV